MRQITDETIGPKTRARMIANRAMMLMRDNPDLTREVADDLSMHMQECYEAWCTTTDDRDKEAAGNTFDLLREIALSYTPADAQHLDTDHREECNCPF
jgi:hypothetical protein